MVRSCVSPAGPSTDTRPPVATSSGHLPRPGIRTLTHWQGGCSVGAASGPLGAQSPRGRQTAMSRQKADRNTAGQGQGGLWPVGARARGAGAQTEGRQTCLCSGDRKEASQPATLGSGRSVGRGNGGLQRLRRQPEPGGPHLSRAVWVQARGRVMLGRPPCSLGTLAQACLSSLIPRPPDPLL